MKKNFILLLFLLSFVYRAVAVDIAEDSKVSFLLPIDWSQDKHIDLYVNIPNGYQSIQPFSQWDKAKLIEFIPKGEQANQWSKIITLHKLIGSRTTASQFIRLFKEEMNKQVKTNILFEKIDDHAASLFISYIDKGRKEVMGLLYLSGPYDCVGVQYTIRLNKGQSEPEALEEIRQFFLQNLKVVEQ